MDAEYADPLELRPDSRLGVVGLIEVQRRGAVTVVNTLGAGILESPGLQRFLPQLAERLLGEKPLLDTPQLYWGGFERERSHLLARLSSLLIKPTVGGANIVGPALSSRQLADLAARIGAAPPVVQNRNPPASAELVEHQMLSQARMNAVAYANQNAYNTHRGLANSGAGLWDIFAIDYIPR